MINVFSGIEAKYLKDIQNNNYNDIHKFNYAFIDKYLLEKKINYDGFIICSQEESAKKCNVINTINNDLIDRFSAKKIGKKNSQVFSVFKNILYYVLKTESNFDINNYTKNNYFIDIFLYKFTYVRKTNIDTIQDFTEILLSDSLEILHNHLFYREKDKAINRIMLIYELLIEYFLKNGYSSRYTEVHLNNIKQEIIIEHYKKAALKEEEENEEKEIDIENNSKMREPLKTNFSEEELKRIFNELVEQKYISCDEDLFLSCFGYKKEEKEDKIVWMKIKTEFEIFISEIVQKEKNPVNKEMCLPRKKINCWFVDGRKKPIKPTPKSKISCGIESYQTYKIIHP